MKTTGQVLAIAAMCATLGGCAAWKTELPVTPITYNESRGTVQRTVGKLRVLTALAIDQEAPQACGKGFGGKAQISKLTGRNNEMVEYLTTEKGYEIIALDTAHYADWLKEPANEAFIREVTEWSSDTSGDTPIGPITRSLIEHVKQNEGIDGLLIMHIQDLCDRANWALRTLAGVATLGIFEVFPDRELTRVSPTYRASIIEIASGRPVWRNSIAIKWQVTLDNFSSSKPRSNYFDVLFEALDSATPKLLTR